MARTCFVLVDKRGTSTYYAVNPQCLNALPNAVDLIMDGSSGLCCAPTTTTTNNRAEESR